MLGQPVANELALQGFEVRALLRDPSKAEGQLHPDIRILKGDLKDKAAVNRTLEGSDLAYISLSVDPATGRKDYQPEREGVQALLQAAGKHSIKGVGYLSSLVQRYQGMQGFDWWAFELKNQIVRRIRESGLPYLLFYPSTFMENFDQGNYRQGNRITLAGKSEHPMHFIAGRDYARQVSQAFLQFEGQSREYVIQGPQAYTADEAAAIFTQYFEREQLSISKLPYGLLGFLGNFTNTFNYGAKIVKALNRYPEKFEAAETWNALGKPQITLRAYAQAGGAAAWNKPAAVPGPKNRIIK